MKIHPIITNNSLRNIFYILEYGEKQACVIDPCDTKVAQDFLETHNLKLEKIFITHEHYDHYEGIVGLDYKEIYASQIAAQNMPITVTHLIEDKEVFFEYGDYKLKALASPGHAAGHMMFELSKYGKVEAIFSGDVLFQGGVGHTRAGNSEDLYRSVKIFERYVDEVIVYPGHDYLEGNAEFAKTHAPEKYSLMKELPKSKGEEVFFTTLLQERSINPFVGVSEKEFVRLRELKNNF